MDATKQRRLYPPVYFLFAIVGMVVLHVGIPVFQWLRWPANLIGVVPLALGFAVTVIGAGQFRRAGTNIKPFTKSTVLVTTGVFRYSRNPMYVGMLFALLGIALLLGSLTPFLVVPLCARLIAVRFVAIEERDMASQFGREYLDYQSRVRRWL
jgi:protein-S-isoprenylcysteine O-methyltransferase Ste14